MNCHYSVVVSKFNPGPQRPVILVDVIGELGLWWGTSNIGFVGGSLNNRGGQNMIEPAAFGVATCFGPGTRNFRDVVQLLLAADAAFVVNDQVALQKFVANCLSEPAYAAALGQRAASIVATSTRCHGTNIATHRTRFTIASTWLIRFGTQLLKSDIHLRQRFLLY